MNSLNGSKLCPTCGKTISASKPTCATCLASPRLPRWSKEESPLKISYRFGSPDAPDHVKESLTAIYADHEAECGARMIPPEHCVLLPWRDAFTVLLRAEQGLFEFHPQDSDWQVNGWLMEKAGLTPVTPLTEADLGRHGEYWPYLPPNSTNADFAVEVMVQYQNDIEQVSYDNCLERFARLQADGLMRTGADIKAAATRMHQQVYEPLQAAVDAWMEPAIVSLTQA